MTVPTIDQILKKSVELPPVHVPPIVLARLGNVIDELDSLTKPLNVYGYLQYEVVCFAIGLLARVRASLVPQVEGLIFKRTRVSRNTSDSEDS